jgi:methionyl-tRNA formyltransferase
MKLMLMADHHVGLAITRWLLRKYRADMALVVTTSENEIFSLVKDVGAACLVFTSAEQVCAHIRSLDLELDIGVLAWWPKLINQPLLATPKYGFINTHPSLLPHNRGKHSNFWALVEQVPFGVSLHVVEDGVDNGDVVAQASVPYSWEDNGATLYAKACQGMVRLFKETYPIIRTLKIPRHKQQLAKGSFHFAKELEAASLINLERHYKARDLFNVIRARTFPGHPACWFTDAGSKYEVRVEINKKVL